MRDGGAQDIPLEVGGGVAQDISYTVSDHLALRRARGQPLALQPPDRPPPTSAPPSPPPPPPPPPLSPLELDDGEGGEGGDGRPLKEVRLACLRACVAGCLVCARA